jgi:signal transduction protein with GAF and PtsI domain
MKTKKKISNGKNIVEALTRISEAITSDLYLEDILKLIVSVTAEVMGSKICSLWILDEKKKILGLRATQAIDEEYVKERTLKLGEGVVGFVAQRRQPMIVPDVLKDPKYKEKPLAKKLGLHSMLSVPMEVKGKVIGVVNSYNAENHKFTRNEINVLKSIANQAAIVMENFRLVVESKVIKEELEARKAIERAKGILMKQGRLNEEEAYNRIRKYSMDKRRSMREVSEAIILSEEMRKGHKLKSK